MTSLSQWHNVYLPTWRRLLPWLRKFKEQKGAKLAAQCMLISMMVALDRLPGHLEPVGNSGPGSPGLFESQVTDQRVGELRGRKNLSRSGHCASNGGMHSPEAIHEPGKPGFARPVA